MKFEAQLDKPALMETIRREYGYPVSTLTHVPRGMVGCHYIAECDDGQRQFITLLVENAMAALQNRRLDFNLGLMQRLLEGGLFRALPAVRRTRRGDLRTSFQGQPLIVYEYIDALNLDSDAPYPPDVLTGLGRLTAQLHCATAALGMDIPFVEQYQLPFEQPLLEGLAELEQVADSDRPGKVELRDFILPRRDTLLGLLEHLHALGATARRLNPPHVLVHTDMTPWNILRSPGGELFIVDWEGVMLAPAEADLFLFSGDGFSTLLAEYLRAAGRPHIHPELFAYYFYRRNLEDVTYFILPILHDSKTDQEDRYELDLLKADCIASWPFLETCQEWAAEQIRTAELDG